jgi:ATP-binding cassette, subfamily B, bacterial HlyB/CyaB
MAQDPLTPFELKQYLEQHLTQSLGQSLSESEINTCLKRLQILEPPAGQQVWQSSEGRTGLYIILAGKVRMLDSSNNLVASLETGQSFGALSLFSQDKFQPYAIKASINLKLCYLSSELLQPLLRKTPAIAAHLHQQAILQDLLLLCRCKPLLEAAPLEGLIKVLALLKPLTLAVGKLPKSILKSQRFGLLRSGTLQHESGLTLMSGSFLIPSQFEQKNAWQATQPAEFYGLSIEDWPMALFYLPQLQDVLETDIASSDRDLDSSVIQESRRLSSSKSPSAIQPPSSRSYRDYFPAPGVTVSHWLQRATRRYFFFAQQSASDCGAACLAMVSHYWGKRFSINRLRDMANVDRNGASLRGLAAAAEAIGFSTRPVKASLDQFAKQQLPAIAHWEGRHYVVVYEVSRNRVVLADPAIGQRTLSPKEFKEGWTGNALLLRPTALFQETQESSQPFWQFLDLVKPHWIVLLEVFLTSVLIQLFGLVTPLLTQLLLDRVVMQGSTLTLTAVGLGLLIFGLFRVAMTSLRQYLLDHTANKIDMALIVGFIRHTLRLPLGFFESRYVGDIVSRVQENRKIQRFLTGEALSILLDLLTVFVYVGLMFWYSWRLTLLVLVVIPPFFLVALLATPFLQRISREIFNALVTEGSYLIESLTGIRTVKSMGIEQSVRWHWEELLNQEIKKTFSGQIISNQLQFFSNTLQAIATTALLWYGAWLVIQNQLTIGQLVAFNMLLGNVIQPFQRLTVLWNQFQEVVIAMERINDVLAAKPEEDLMYQSRQSLPQLKGHVRFEQVTFSYHPESDINVLENLSFEIEPGQTVALVGRSGSGKTTISKLVLGLYPPTDGRVLIDGQDVTGLSLRSLRQAIGVVDQSTFLFGSTIRDNIGIGHVSATLEEVMEAAQYAGADEFIKRLPLGYETQIGEGGGMLSGGQRQRLAIARALMGNPHLLILDEATSNLDAESERIIQTNLNTILKGRTTLIIAHRLSTVRNADLILVLDKGILVESGTHDALMAKRGQYFYLNQQQLSTVA